MNKSLEFFFNNTPESPIVLELGTLRWGASATHHKDLFPTASQYVMSDVTSGPDVDVVADLHFLSKSFEPNSFDAIFCCSVFEHLHSPWIAAREILTVLKPGGVAFIQTHQSFPIHGYPNDYYRFSKEALIHLFSGASETVACYEFSAKVVPDKTPDVWLHDHTAYLNVCIGVKK
jgi:SAM-dependent methyltransferase